MNEIITTFLGSFLATLGGVIVALVSNSLNKKQIRVTEMKGNVDKLQNIVDDYTELLLNLSIETNPKIIIKNTTVLKEKIPMIISKSLQFTTCLDSMGGNQAINDFQLKLAESYQNIEYNDLVISIIKLKKDVQIFCNEYLQSKK